MVSATAKKKKSIKNSAGYYFWNKVGNFRGSALLSTTTSRNNRRECQNGKTIGTLAIAPPSHNATTTTTWLPQVSNKTRHFLPVLWLHFHPPFRMDQKCRVFSISWKQAAFSSVYNGLDEKCLFWLPSSTLLACLSSRIGLQSREVFWDFLSGSAINLRKSRSSSITECG